MDLKQLYYIVKIAEESNITRAANGFFVSQSALNQQLLKVEAELGTQLFQRVKGGLLITEAGRIYVDYAKQILNLKKEAYSKIHDISNNESGTFSIGLTPERGINMFMSVYPEFYRKYPRITVVPREIAVRRQLQMLSDGQLDIGFMTLTKKDMTPSNTFIRILEEPILLAVPRSHPLAARANPPGQDFAELDLSELRYEPFVLMFKDSTMRTVIDALFERAGFSPNILFETASNQTLCNMVKNKMACSLISRNYVCFQEQIAYFYLPSRPVWELCACYKKDSYLTIAAKEFITSATSFYQKKASEPITT